MRDKTVIVWFRQDLRLSDNPTLSAAVQAGAEIYPVYILDDENAGAHKMGAASRVWLHHALHDLNVSLNGNLAVFQGDAAQIIPELAKDIKAQGVYWNRCYEPWRIARDKRIKSALQDAGRECHSFNGSLLWEPWDVLKKDGTPYKVFTPFYQRGCLGRKEPRAPLPAPKSWTLFKPQGGCAIDDLMLEPSKPEPRWDRKMIEHWDISEKGAQKRLHDFLDDGLKHYKEGRNYPAQDSVSRLSPYLHCGQLSPNQAWHAAKFKGQQNHSGANLDMFLSELGWREFSHHLLYHFPGLPHQNFQPRFDSFRWLNNTNALRTWQKGRTGYPIVDAAMRELWETGYMHNRARMIVGSFLCKHLLTHWTEGEAWFWDCLFDADLANNAASWQWIAGTGADAAPYFRIFNPVTQGEKFDSQGEYVRQWVPEIAGLPDKYIHKPWEAPPEILTAANVILGETYPSPIVDHSAARQRALDVFRKTK